MIEMLFTGTSSQVIFCWQEILFLLNSLTLTSASFWKKCSQPWQPKLAQRHSKLQSSSSELQMANSSTREVWTYLPWDSHFWQCSKKMRVWFPKLKLPMRLQSCICQVDEYYMRGSPTKLNPWQLLTSPKVLWLRSRSEKLFSRWPVPMLKIESEQNRLFHLCWKSVHHRVPLR